MQGIDSKKKFMNKKDWLNAKHMVLVALNVENINIIFLLYSEENLWIQFESSAKLFNEIVNRHLTMYFGVNIIKATFYK